MTPSLPDDFPLFIMVSSEAVVSFLSRANEMSFDSKAVLKMFEPLASETSGLTAKQHCMEIISSMTNDEQE